MEEAGVKIDMRRAGRNVAAAGARDRSRRRARSTRSAGDEFNINSPKQLGDVLFNKLNLPKPMKYGKGKTISTAVDVLEGLAAEHEVPRLVLEYRQLSKLKSTYVDALPALLNPAPGGCTPPSTDRHRHRPAVVDQSQPAEHSHPHRAGPRDPRRLHRRAGHVLLAADYSQIELRLLAHFSGDPLLVEAFRTRRRHSHPHRLAGVRRAAADGGRRASPPRQGGELRHRLRPVAVRLSQQLGIDTKEAKEFIEAYFEKYSGVREFIDRTLEQARRDRK